MFKEKYCVWTRFPTKCSECEINCFKPLSRCNSSVAQFYELNSGHKFQFYSKDGSSTVLIFTIIFFLLHILDLKMCLTPKFVFSWPPEICFFAKIGQISDFSHTAKNIRFLESITKIVKRCGKLNLYCAKVK